MSIIKARSPFTIKHIEPNVPDVLPIFTCEDTEITGLAIAADGTVTNPTVSVGTFHSIEPSVFTTVEEEKIHNVTVLITYNASTHRSPYETSSELRCVVQVTQEATAVSTTCLEWYLNNRHQNYWAHYSYYDCSNTLRTGQIVNGATLIVCVYPGTAPEVWGNYQVYASNLNLPCT